jgi:hypothetical protein
VSGTFFHEAASTIANIDFLSSVSLPIAGHTYSIDEIKFTNHFLNK